SLIAQYVVIFTSCSILQNYDNKKIKYSKEHFELPLQLKTKHERF
ncbi:unnamed protein product, partial [Rotaria sordida]